MTAAEARAERDRLAGESEVAERAAVAAERELHALTEDIEKGHPTDPGAFNDGAVRARMARVRADAVAGNLAAAEQALTAAEDAEATEAVLGALKGDLSRLVELDVHIRELHETARAAVVDLRAALTEHGRLFNAALDAARAAGLTPTLDPEQDGLLCSKLDRPGNTPIWGDPRAIQLSGLKVAPARVRWADFVTRVSALT